MVVMDLDKIKIRLKKAKLLTTNHVTASGIRDDFNKNNMPFFYHSYDAQRAFMAVPPSLLRDLATKAGEDKFASEIGEKMTEIEQEKEKIINDLKKQAKAKFGTKKKS